MVDFVANLLIRYFMRGRQATPQNINNIKSEDTELLLLHWSISQDLEELCRYLRESPHELQTIVQSIERINDSAIRGKINATKTALIRLVTGNTSLVSYSEPIKNYDSGPNLVLAYSLRIAQLYATRFVSRASEKSIYNNRAREVLSKINEVNKIEIFQRVIRSANISRRPNAKTLLQAAQSRKPLYRQAYKVYKLLEGVEKNDRDTIQNILQQTLIQPLKDYQLFELSLALYMAESLSVVLDKKPIIGDIGPNIGENFIRVGDISIGWQTKTVAWCDPIPEPSETIVSTVLQQFNLGPGNDRPDLIVRSTITGAVLSIGEAKYFKDLEDALKGSLRGAISQIVRYARGYSKDEDITKLISTSIIGLYNYPKRARPEPTPLAGPIVIDFQDMQNTENTEWATRVLNSN